MKRLRSETAAQLDDLLPALLDRAWTPSPQVRSGFAPSLREDHLAQSPIRSAQKGIANTHDSWPKARTVQPGREFIGLTESHATHSITFFSRN